MFPQYALPNSCASAHTKTANILNKHSGRHLRSQLRFEKGEANILEKTTAISRHQQIKNQLQLLDADLFVILQQFNFLLSGEFQYVPKIGNIKIEIPVDRADTSLVLNNSPQLALARHREEVANFQWRTEKAKLLPEFRIGYNNQSLVGPQQVNRQEHFYKSSRRFSYVTAGISIPIFFKAATARIAAAKTDWERSRSETDYTQKQMALALDNASRQVLKFGQSLSFYEEQVLKNADKIIETADRQFKAGEIDYLQWVILSDQGIAIKTEYMNVLGNYNASAIQLLKLNNL
jgi:heavy metal efflux system protein